ncbi:MAG: hypothetical protein ACK4GN_10940 [Runella sp.]
MMTLTTIITSVPTQAALFCDWREDGHKHLTAFEKRNTSYVRHLPPEIAVKLDVFQVLAILEKRLGTSLLLQALDPTQTIPLAEIPLDSTWLKKSNMVGVNVRTIGSFWRVVSYAFTLPPIHDSIHLLPIWEPGVVGSLYGKVSWKINDEFFSYDLQRAIPWLDTVEKQLKVVVNLLHALGKKVGLDVIPHTDRFSEIVLTHPRLFEWIRREGGHITDHREGVWQQVEEAIWQFLQHHGTADGSWIMVGSSVFFDPDVPLLTDAQRQHALFGIEARQRLERRIALIQWLIERGYETLPMTMAPPYRGLHINPDVFVLDERGTRWYQYEFDKPQAMSRVFGPLTRYRFYHSKNDNQDWELNFDRPQEAAWRYFCRKYYECQQQYNFDFMRGDMAHVQMRPEGVPTQVNQYYDPLLAVKKYIQKQGVKHFAFYAETFLAPPDTMGYGDELAHLEAIEADATLGDLQSAVVGSEVFMQRFADYDHWLRSRRFAPSFTIITADKDDPRFDEFYRTGNLVRYFIGLFLTDMPSYYSLGFEVRNLHVERAPNEEYSKLYVFQIHDDAETDKVTHGPFVWGKNKEQFAQLGRLRAVAEEIWPQIEGKDTHWLLAPDATAKRKLIAWTQVDQPLYVFVVNMDSVHEADLGKLVQKNWELIFDTNASSSAMLSPMSGRVYRMKASA